MKSNTSPHRPLRRVVPVVAIAALAVVPASASAAKAKPAKLTVTQVSAPPSGLKPGQRFTVSGKVKNTGGKSTPALISFELRSKGGRTVRYALGGDAIRKIAKGSTRTFKTRVSVASSAVLKDDTSFLLAACAKRTRNDARLSCRKATAATTIPASTAPAPTAPAPAAPAPVGGGEPTPTPAPAPDDPTVYTPGARSLGDTLFPTIGNGGYDALHYDLDLRYTVASEFLRGTVTMTARATQDLSDFSLDFTRVNAVSAVTVNGVPASFEQDDVGQKLIVTPAKGIRTDTSFDVAVTYAGIQKPYTDPDGSSEGWISDPENGAVVVSEPVGAMGWFPNNDVPFDKASYSTRMTVPAGFSVVATGIFKAKSEGATESTFEWEEDAPTASYLYSVAIGQYDLSSPDPASPTMTAPTGGLNTPVPFHTAVASAFTTGKANMLENLNRTPSILDYIAGYYDVKYPFSAAGGVVPLAAVGYSLETQGKPTYANSTSPTFTGPGISTIAHENGHMWFGDAVTLTQWKDIWLNEGMTEFTSWLWQANANAGTPMTTRFSTTYNSTSTTFWRIAPANPPTAADIFNTNAMYTRGATTMEAIREILGEPAFRPMMKRWLNEHLYGNATTEQFIALVKESDPARSTDPTRDARWTEFFRQWLYTSYTGSPAAGNKPSVTPTNFATFTLPG
jgi:hypothetical protein